AGLRTKVLKRGFWYVVLTAFAPSFTYQIAEKGVLVRNSGGIGALFYVPNCLKVGLVRKPVR
ncbi:MAG: hypothetical protein IKX83_00385, partial [Clostridia bacterium]|nr:hypothetical protein [Clostridia bacterium]